MEVVSTSYPEHVLRKIHDCTFRPKDFLSHFFHPNSPGNLFISIIKNYDDLILVIDSKSPFFHYFFSTFHNKTPGFSLNFYFSSLKNSKFLFYSSTLNTPTFSPFPSPYIHHCKNTLSSLHIFVHHCTFCASLHVKACRFHTYGLF